MGTKLPPRTTGEKIGLLFMVILGVVVGVIFGAISGSIVAAAAQLNEVHQIVWILLLSVLGVAIAVPFMIYQADEPRRRKAARNARSVSGIAPPVGTAEWYLWKQDLERNYPWGKL
ncbi:hypothetical protein [Amycolatopsis samaneae]|uniref:Uncharacterized protein n=1 Tax=Amycolatopsis samaneae TaxID=664691 RepID=A0ABW5GGY3_9PSEU